MDKLKFNYTQALPFVELSEMVDIEKQIVEAAASLSEKSGKGNDFLGWMNLPLDYDKEEFEQIKKSAEIIKIQSEVVVVIGIGGSYLGAKAAIEFLTHSFNNNLSREERKTPEIYFAGINLSGQYISDLMDVIGDRSFSLIMISKSGTTTEPAIAFRILKNKLIQKYGEEPAKKRIFAITDKQRGALKELSNQEGYQTFVVPDDVGGRFSVLTAVGLLPIACAGIDIDQLMNGARDAIEELMAPYESNACYQYVALRNILYRQGRKIEMLINYEPKLAQIAEWWKQLFGESEGKDGLGIFPASANFTADLHSLGQYLQDGERHIFETLLEIENPDYDVIIESDARNLDGLNYLSGRSMDYINKKAAEGSMEAHVEGGVPNLKISIARADAYHLGYLLYFFMKSCAVSGYLLGVNPFDQPGVEAYKKNMFRLLGKEGY